MDKKFGISRWIFLSLAIMADSFLILYSCLSANTTNKWNWFVTNIFSSIVNTFTEKEVINKPVENIELFLSNEETYRENYLLGYELNEIPLGSSKQIEYKYYPSDATDHFVEYYAENNNVSFSQNGDKMLVIGMKPGNTTIHAKNKLSGIDVTYDVTVVETVEPQAFDISIESNTIPIGSQQTINIDIDGGNLGHNELLNFRFYDYRRLNFESSNEDVLTIDNYGVIHPLSVGASTITVSNAKGVSKSLDLTVTHGITPTPYSDLNIYGSNVCFANDMIYDSNTHNNHYQLGIKDGETILNAEDFVWESSNELLAKVDKHGVLRGFKKTTSEDEGVTITATSKIIPEQSVTFDVVVKEEIPTEMYFCIYYGGKELWNYDSVTACVGDIITVDVGFTPKTANKSFTITIENGTLLECSKQSRTFSLRVLNTGECNVTITSESNLSISATIKFTLLKAGAIGSSNINNVGYSLRKVIGHATLFAVAQAFTFIALYMFLYNKKIWLYSLISFGIGLILAIMSEIIELLVPTRHGRFLDVLIDMSGVVIALAICVTIIIVTHRLKTKKNNN